LVGLEFIYLSTQFGVPVGRQWTPFTLVRWFSVYIFLTTTFGASGHIQAHYLSVKLKMLHNYNNPRDPETSSG